MTTRATMINGILKMVVVAMTVKMTLNYLKPFWPVCFKSIFGLKKVAKTVMLDYIFWGGGTLKIGTQGISSIPFIIIFFIVFQIDHHVTEDCPKTKMDCDFLEIGCNHNVRILHYSIYYQDSVQFD